MSVHKYLLSQHAHPRATTMGLLDKLWDDTVAGPQPENGLSKLRKYSTFSSRSSSNYKETDEFSDEATRVTRSIMIIKPSGNLSTGSGTPPPSPAGITPPVSPFAGARGDRDVNRFRRKSSSDAYERAEIRGKNRSTFYD